MRTRRVLQQGPFTDRYPTSIEAALGLDGEPLLFDDDYAPKPAYFGVRDALAGLP